MRIAPPTMGARPGSLHGHSILVGNRRRRQQQARHSMASCAQSSVAVETLASSRALPTGAPHIPARRPEAQLKHFGPYVRTAAERYMAKRLRCIHVGTQEFANVFKAFTEHSLTDCWGEDASTEARGQQKAGAISCQTTALMIANRSSNPPFSKFFKAPWNGAKN